MKVFDACGVHRGTHSSLADLRQNSIIYLPQYTIKVEITQKLLTEEWVKCLKEPKVRRS